MSEVLSAIVMGKSGAGKTTFYNKLCETDHLATYSSTSLTRQLYRSEVVHGGKRFTIMDTPGTDSKEEVFKHSYLLKEALTHEPLNAIFTLVEFNDRCDSAFEEFEKSISYLKKEYHEMVVVMVSKIDRANISCLGRVKADYRKLFAEEGFSRISFCSSDMSARTIAAEMVVFMQTLPKRQLYYEQADFLKYFRIADESRAQKKVVDKMKSQVHEILQSYKEVLQTSGFNRAEMDEIIMCAIASSRYDIDQIYDKFIADFGERAVDLDCYTNSIALQKVIENAHREFRTSAKELMSYNPDDTSDWKNCIRKCQYCGQVWVKVSGCNGVTSCGAREPGADVSGKPWFRYFFVPSNGHLTVAWNHQPHAAEPAADNPSNLRQRLQPGGKGCGKEIDWSLQPRLSKDELEKCFEVKGLENIIRSMQSQPDFQRTMSSYESTIDASFSS
eukprot:TRINITY_DN41096_c0_g1_i1.p1 TRINITY_DN41096_c0_g1~~TRINITY_DN41096_c0_g1_i1.p1  ORF type:complete len:458 (+),score=75.54 TRINITY_DN41096_c0_g1_i1:41-1375(+)